MGQGFRRGMAFLLAALIPLLLLSCSSDASPAGSAGMPVKSGTTLTFMSYWGGSSAYRDLVEETISDFMKANPDITIANESISSEDYLSKLKTDFVSGYMPDVFYLWPGYDIDALISAGQVANIKESLSGDSKWDMSFSSFAMEHNRINMGVYGVPFETCFTGLYVNKRIFADNGITIPRTYDDLKQAVIELNKDGIIPIAYSAKMDGSLLFQTLVAASSDRSTSLQYPANKTSDPSYVEAMKTMKELYRMNAFPKDSFTLNGYDQNKLFLSGKAAMIVQGSWFSGYIGQMQDPVGIVPFPDMNPSDNAGYNMICVNGYGSFHLSSKAYGDPKIKDACIRFLKYFTSTAVAERFIAEKGMISALSLDDEAYGSNYYAREGLDIIRKSNDIYKLPSELFGEDVFNDIFIEKFPYMLEDRITPEELYEQAINRMPER